MCFKRNTKVPLFLFLWKKLKIERKKNMRRFQKLQSSAIVLLVAILAITCFTRGITQIILYGISLLSWCVYAFITQVIPMIQRYKYRMEVKQIVKQEENSRVIKKEELDPKLSYLLLCHVNHRITGYIKSTYPDATWAWISNDPAEIIANGGTGRIELFGVKDYNFADISFDNDANIECTLLKVVSLKQAVQKEVKDAAAKEAKSEIDPQVWFEKSGRVVLKNLIADLSSRGHNTLTIQEDGSCIVEQGDKTLKVRQLDAFPEKVYHPKLIKVLAGAGISAKTVDAGLAVNW